MVNDQNKMTSNNITKSKWITYPYVRMKKTSAKMQVLYFLLKIMVMANKKQKKQKSQKEKP